MKGTRNLPENPTPADHMAFARSLNKPIEQHGAKVQALTALQKAMALRDQGVQGYAGKTNTELKQLYSL